MSQSDAKTSAVRWGILSTAEIAHKTVSAIHNASNAQAVAVASRDLARAEAWAKSHDVPRSYGSYDELVADPEVDAIYIPLPSAFKKEWAIKCAQAGKHVLVEKPFSGSVDDVTEMIDACAANNVQFMDGTMWKHSTRTQVVKQQVADGKIGAVQRVNASFTFKAPNEEWLHGGNGRTDKTREPMGCFGDQGWYTVGGILWAFSYEAPVKVQMTYTILNRVDTIVSCGGVLYFNGNRTANFDCGVLESHRSFLELSGSEGRILLDDHVGGQARTGDFGAYFGPFSGSDRFIHGDTMGLDTTVPVNACDHDTLLIEKFSSIVTANTLEPNWPSETLLQHRVMEALFRSSQSDGAPISLVES